MNPPLPLTLLVAVVLAATTLACWLSWRDTRVLSPSRRYLFLTLRAVGFLIIGTFLLNPGAWILPSHLKTRPWYLLIDQSASMAQTNDATGETRIAMARRLAAKAQSVAEKHDIPLRVHPFALEAGPVTDDPASIVANGSGSDLLATLRQLNSQAAGDSPAGFIVLSDGRQTTLNSDQDVEALALSLRAHPSTLHAVATGGDSPVRDLALRITRPTLTTFPGQAVKVPFSIETRGLGKLRPEVVLSAPDGETVATMQLDLEDDKPVFAQFEITPPFPKSLTIASAVHPDELIPGNNSGKINIRTLDAKTRVFLAEGAPYWDSKFLAQLLRQQAQMEVHSVHRISDERYFRIDSGQADPTDAGTAVFPKDLDELSRYDLIVFGKNVDSFLTPSRIDALRTYVRDQGGAVLFARGRPVTASVPALESLEPVTWASTSAGSFRFEPSSDGEAAGLFGEILPAPGASVWTSLPPLKDGRQIALVKPFTRVLAEGSTEGSNSLAGRFPALLVRRYGQGVTGLVNGDGLWSWDFFPEARELGNMYEDFWIQLIQWMASYSEFLPGHDFSLRLSSLRTMPDISQQLTMSYRGGGEVDDPILLVTAPDGSERELVPARHPDPAGHPHWRSSLTPNQPGTWRMQLLDPRADAPPAPGVTLEVLSPPRESDNLTPDQSFLESITTATGGRLVDPVGWNDFLNTAFQPEAPSASHAEAIWQPSWLRWPLAILAVIPFALEWWLRRRQGLS